jgi:predicted Ser/Thr protein kinase
LDLKTAIIGKNDEGILQECMRADIAAVKEYEKVVDYPEYLFDSKGIIRKQLHRIQKTLNTIKKMKYIVD